MFGVGGGFLMTPLLVFLGIGSGVAVASSANYMAASSFSGALSYSRRRMVDLKLSSTLFVGGLLGTFSGVWLFTKLRALGQLDLMVSISYLVLLTAVGGLMLTESLLVIWRQRRASSYAAAPALTPGFTVCRSRFASTDRRSMCPRSRFARSVT